MRHTFNEDSIEVGFIKELLHNFELPKCEVYSSNVNSYPGKVYIKNWHLARCTKKYTSFIDSEMSYIKCEWKNLDHYVPGHKYLNLTEKFEINSQTYDYETHVWLGNYLRFIRDYYNEDLMGLYNCFFNHTLKNVNFSFQKDDNNKVVFNTDDSSYDYYYFPVRLNKKYTVAITCPSKYEIACLFYDKRMIRSINEHPGVGDRPSENVNLSQAIARETYLSTTSNFFTPYIYSTEVKDDYIDKYKVMESCLKMVIKVPHGISTTITVLEGDFRYGTPMMSSVTPRPSPNSKVSDTYGPLYVNGYNHKFENGTISRFGTRLSLLHYNNGTSYPFADKLIPYLLGYVIDVRDDISRNISRISDVIFPGSTRYAKGIWNDKIRSKICSMYYHSVVLYNDSVGKPVFDFLDSSYDVLYYIDKDVEKVLGSTTYVDWNGD